jgi:hypothetical protein
MQASPDPVLSSPAAATGRSLRSVAIIVGVAAGAAVAAIVLGLLPDGKKTGGFLGPGTLSGDVNLILEILLVLGLTFGFYLARSGNIEAHRVNQTLWVLVNAALVATIMASTLKEVKVTNLSDLAEARYWVTWLHALVGTLTVAAGLWLVLQMNDILPRRLHIGWWKNLMRLTLAGYWIVVLLGFATYYFYYTG